MTITVAQQDPIPANAAEAAAQSPVAPAQPPAIVARRQSCDADGVGLSHYILMDRKPAA
ncbi:hypothetical protein RHDC4_00791 [Rhodocyclaceae bacterium]|nr:hypothetical protein RHDC4_00791 [Rhodocyclaceae bacterium]